MNAIASHNPPLRKVPRYLIPERLPTLSSAQRRETKRRQQKLDAYEAALASGLNKTQAARRAGLSPVTCWRYQQALARDGRRGLIPRFDRAGRRRGIEKHNLTPANLATVQRLFLACGSAERAWRWFAELRLCPADFAAWVQLSETLPLYLLRAARPRRRIATTYQGEDFLIVVVPSQQS